MPLSVKNHVFPCIFPSIREKTETAAGRCSDPLGTAPRVLCLVIQRIDAWRPQLDARHRLEDLGSDRKALLPPALRLSAVQHVVGEETKIGGRADVARELAGEC